jgi:hypothetical protein
LDELALIIMLETGFSFAQAAAVGRLRAARDAGDIDGLADAAEVLAAFDEFAPCRWWQIAP